MLETLRRRAALERAAEGQRAIDARLSVARAVAAAPLPAGSRVWLIGSLAWGGFGERSDVDLVFEGVDDATMINLEVALTGTIGCDIDLLRWSELTPAFQERIQRDGVPLHGV